MKLVSLFALLLFTEIIHAQNKTANEQKSTPLPAVICIDGNPTFKPDLSMYTLDSYSMIIYDRWGEVVFKTDEVNKGWTGRIDGKPVQEGEIYYYVIEYHIASETSSHTLNGSAATIMCEE